MSPESRSLSSTPRCSFFTSANCSSYTSNLIFHTWTNSWWSEIHDIHEPHDSWHDWEGRWGPAPALLSISGTLLWQKMLRIRLKIMSCTLHHWLTSHTSDGWTDKIRLPWNKTLNLANWFCRSQMLAGHYLRSISGTEWTDKWWSSIISLSYIFHLIFAESGWPEQCGPAMASQCFNSV